MRSSNRGSRSKVQRRRAFLFAQRDFFRLRFEGLLDLLLLQLLELQQHMPQIAADDFFLHAQFFAGLLDEHRALPRRVQIERVHVKAALVRTRCRFAWLAMNQHVYFQQFIAHVLCEPRTR